MVGIPDKGGSSCLDDSGVTTVAKTTKKGQSHWGSGGLLKYLQKKYFNKRLHLFLK